MLNKFFVIEYDVKESSSIHEALIPFDNIAYIDVCKIGSTIDMKGYVKLFLKSGQDFVIKLEHKVYYQVDLKKEEIDISKVKDYFINPILAK